MFNLYHFSFLASVTAMVPSYILANFKYIMLLLTRIIMLYTRYPEIIHHETEILHWALHSLLFIFKSSNFHSEFCSMLSISFVFLYNTCLYEMRRHIYVCKCIFVYFIFYWKKDSSITQYTLIIFSFFSSLPNCPITSSLPQIHSSSSSLQKRTFL